MVHRRTLGVGGVALALAVGVLAWRLSAPATPPAADQTGLGCTGSGAVAGCPSPTGAGMTSLTPTPTTPNVIVSSQPGSTAPTPGPSLPSGASPTPSGPVAPTRSPSAALSPSPTPAPTPRPSPSPAPRPTPRPSPAPTPVPAAAWRVVVDDQFDSGGVPSHWSLYETRYGSGAKNCAEPSHVTVSGGAMHILMAYEASGPCGAGWYTGGMMISDAYGSVDQRVTLRFRVVNHGVQGHYIIPMRWPDTAPWPSGGEEDYCETSDLTTCTTFLHYGADNSQLQHDFAVDLTRWHVMQFTRRKHVVTVAVDGTVVWTYRGTATTLPDTVKRVVLQQECQSTCPAVTTGSEDIQIDWITIENPAS